MKELSPNETAIVIQILLKLHAEKDYAAKIGSFSALSALAIIIASSIAGKEIFFAHGLPLSLTLIGLAIFSVGWAAAASYLRKWILEGLSKTD